MDPRTRDTRAPASSASQLDGRHWDRSTAAGTRATLTAEDVDAIAEATARRIVEMTGVAPPTFGLVGPRELAEDLGVSVDYVYAHAGELGAMRLGSGPKARIRFDLDRARRTLIARKGGPARRPRRR